MITFDFKVNEKVDGFKKEYEIDVNNNIEASLTDCRCYGIDSIT